MNLPPHCHHCQEGGGRQRATGKAVPKNQKQNEKEKMSHLLILLLVWNYHLWCITALSGEE